MSEVAYDGLGHDLVIVVSPSDGRVDRVGWCWVCQSWRLNLGALP